MSFFSKRSKANQHAAAAAAAAAAANNVPPPVSALPPPGGQQHGGGGESIPSSSSDHYHGPSSSSGYPRGPTPPQQGGGLGSGMPPSGGTPRMASNGSYAPGGPSPQATPAVVYPWSRRLLNLPAPHPSQAGLPQLMPFPRYGLSTPPVATPSGHLFLFGGLVSESVRNDLFLLDCKTLTVAPVPPKGEVPIARVGHATALVGNVLITWGGDTKTQVDDEQDQGLYLLNMASNEWSCIRTGGSANSPNRPDMPMGRYGHAVCMYRNRFMVFGGQVDLTFFNDLWCFDLTSIKSPDGPSWERIEPVTEAPRARTGHVCVTYRDEIILFGGTDGEFHYNDTWSYNILTREWTELDCIGYLPVAREGHAAALVGDVVYVFGGRDVKGQDLGDLAAFKVSTKRWFMFQNMGPSPEARSGHAMSAYGDKILVLGGESTTMNPQTKSELDRVNHNVIHVLDTSKIKYPPDQARPAGQGAVIRKVSQPQIIHQPQHQQIQHQQQQSMSPTTGTAAAFHHNRNGSGSDSRSISPIAAKAASAAAGGGAGTPSLMQAVDRSQQQTGWEPPRHPQQLEQQQGAMSLTGGNPNANAKRGNVPQRPRRDDDAAYGVGGPGSDPSRAMSPSNNNGSRAPWTRSSPMGSPTTANFPSSSASTSRVTSPTNGQQQQPETYLGDVATESSSPPSGSIPRGQVPFASTVSGRSSSPVVGGPDGSGALASSPLSTNHAPPPDAFYSPRSPAMSTGAGARSFGGGGSSVGHGRQGSLSGLASSELRAKDAELDSYKRRERWLKLELARAAKAGFVMDDGEKSALGEEFGDEGSDVRRLSERLLALKREKAQLHSDLSSQTQSLAQKVAEAERVRQGAVQEAAFYRAKVHVLESSSSPEDLAQLERQRSAELERQLASISAEHTSLQRQITQLAETSALERQLRTAAEDREAEAVRRATTAESDHLRSTEELHALHLKHSVAESSLRDHAERLVSLGSLTQRHETDRDVARNQHDEMRGERDLHLVALEQAQTALGHAGVRAEEAEALYQREHERAATLETEVSELRQEIEIRSREAEAATSRLADVEAAWGRSREEAESLRVLSASGLGELLTLHRGIKSDTDRSTRGHEEKTRALDQEASSLRKMLQEAGSRVDETQSVLAQFRSRQRQLEADQITSRKEFQAARAALAAAQAETGRFKEQLTAKEAEVRDRSAAAGELELRLSMLRNLLADRGIAVSDDDLRSEESGSSSRLRDLESKLSEKSQLHEESEHELDLSRRRVENAEARVEELMQQLAGHHGAGPTSTSREVGGEGGGEASDDITALRTRAEVAKKQFAEAEVAHAARVKQVEGDYQQAVQYVKATEKMLRRMKDDLTKQKSANTVLQAELDILRGTNSSEAGSRTRDANGRNTPVLDDDSLRAKLLDAQRQVVALSKLSSDHQSLTADHAALKEEHGRLKEVYSQDLDEANNRIDQLQAEVDRLGQLSAGAGDVKRLEAEYEDLKTENEDLQRKIRLLLDTQDYEDRVTVIGDHRISAVSNYENSENELDEEDLDQYIRAHSPPTGQDSLPNDLHGQFSNGRPR